MSWYSALFGKIIWKGSQGQENPQWSSTVFIVATEKNIVLEGE
jgi:hypothetical protein